MRSTATPRRTVAAILARNRLGAPTIAVFVIAAAAPLTVVAGAAGVGFGVTGHIGVPVAYAAIAAVLAAYATGYVAMSRHIGNAGAIYAYVTAGLGRPPGVAAAFTALAAYSALQISLYGAAGVVLATIGTETGITAPWWAWSAAVWLTITVCAARSITFNARLLAALIAAEIAVLVVVDAALITAPADGRISLAALDPATLFTATAAPVLVAAVAGFLGFEATTVYAEEARDPRRTIARATYAALAVIGLLYAVSAWAMTVAAGADARIIDASRQHGVDLLFILAADRLPAAVINGGYLLFAASLLASALAFHNMIARYLFALGREGVIPPGFARVHARTGAPVTGAAAQSTVAAVAIVLAAGFGLDPITHLFFWVGVLGAFGVVLLLAAAGVAVVVYLHRRGESGCRIAITAAGTLALALLAAGTLVGFGDLIDVALTHPARALPTVYAGPIGAGVVYALILRRIDPRTYAGIGLGANITRTTR